jgi:RND family efflux transporter MFP subunit
MAPPPTPAGSAHRAWTRTRPHRRALAGYLAVALVALGIGAGTTFLALTYTGARAQSQAAPAGEHAGHAAGSSAAARPAGEHPSQAGGKTVYISPARQQLIGVRTEEVTHRALDTTVRTVGVLAYDETRVTQIHTKIAGWVDRLYVDFVGKPVRRGQPLFTIYSPELVSTQNEYLLARKAYAQLGESRFEETREGARALLAASRDRLRLWDISEAQIEELERTGTPRRTLTLYSPFNGIVLERNTFAGQYVTPEMTTFKIADLSTIWAIGQIFEYESQLVKVGQEVTVEFPYEQATRTLRGKVTFIYPDVDPMTRRLRVRAEFVNPGLELKPDTFVTLTIRGGERHELAIPAEAVIDTGTTRYAILAHPDGYFEPREIETGAPLGGYYPVVKGLQHGDRVVTSAQFLIDSETNLQAAMQAMAGHGHGGMEMGGSGHEGHEGMEMPEQAPPAPKPGGPSGPAGHEGHGGSTPSGSGGHEGHGPGTPAGPAAPSKRPSDHGSHGR